MIILVVLCSFLMTLYVHIWLRDLARRCVMKHHHSKSYLKKLKQKATRWERFTGYYLVKDGAIQEKWLLPSLRLICLNLLTIVATSLVGVLAIVRVIPEETGIKVIAALTMKDIWFAAILFVVTFTKFRRLYIKY